MIINYLDAAADIITIIGVISLILGLSAWFIGYWKNKIFGKILLYLSAIDSKNLSIEWELLFDSIDKSNISFILKEFKEINIKDILDKWEEKFFQLLKKYLNFFELKQLEIKLNYYGSKFLKQWDELNNHTRDIFQNLDTGKKFYVVPYCKKNIEFKKYPFFKIKIELKDIYFSIIIFIDENNSTKEINFLEFALTQIKELREEFKEKEKLWNFIYENIFKVKSYQEFENFLENKNVAYDSFKNLESPNENSAHSKFVSQKIWNNFCKLIMSIDETIMHLNVSFGNKGHYPILYWKNYEQVSEVMKNSINLEESKKEGN